MHWWIDGLMDTSVSHPRQSLKLVIFSKYRFVEQKNNFYIDVCVSRNLHSSKGQRFIIIIDISIVIIAIIIVHNTFYKLLVTFSFSIFGAAARSHSC